MGSNISGPSTYSPHFLRNGGTPVLEKAPLSIRLLYAIVFPMLFSVDAVVVLCSLIGTQIACPEMSRTHYHFGSRPRIKFSYDSGAQTPP